MENIEEVINKWKPTGFLTGLSENESKYVAMVFEIACTKNNHNIYSDVWTLPILRGIIQKQFRENNVIDIPIDRLERNVSNVINVLNNNVPPVFSKIDEYFFF